MTKISDSRMIDTLVIERDNARYSLYCAEVKIKDLENERTKAQEYIVKLKTERIDAKLQEARAEIFSHQLADAYKEIRGREKTLAGMAHVCAEINEQLQRARRDADRADELMDTTEDTREKALGTSDTGEVKP